VCSDLFSGYLHRLVLVEVVALSKVVEHARADIPTNGILDDLILRPAGPGGLEANRVEHIGIELEAGCALGHVMKFASTARAEGFDGGLFAGQDLDSPPATRRHFPTGR